ncbi:cupin [Spirochaetia bacterium]|nr:cupin [Spirochaetia bacterium]
MTIQRSAMKTEQKEKMRDGDGITTFTYFVPNGTEKNARMLAEISLEPGASIGYHQHDTETEYFIFISGIGVVNDNGTEHPIKPGDVMITGNGASHSVKNTGSAAPLVFNALIVTH